jgi:CubicO group peptidase (beta-lactamase class C family)
MAEKLVQEVLATVPARYRGPGGAVAVVKDGELVGQRVWGYADLRRRIPMTPQTQLPICSITKQFVGALLLDLERDPPPNMIAKGDVRKQLADQLSELLSPELLQDSGLTIEHLYDMQSGIRDYWAMTTLWGAQPDDEFLIARDCGPALARTKSFHFRPGTEFSYCNINFHILGRVIERATGESLGKLLEDRILRPAGMTTALLCPNTAQHPPPCIGYENNEKNGYFEAVNRIEWSGDAGLVASLADMIAYEKYLDRLSSDPQSWYRKAIEPQTFGDGNAAPYHYGLGRVDVNGVSSFGHGGALRGYRLSRRHAPQERLSVVVLFNHEGSPSGAVDHIFRGILKLPKPENAPLTPTAGWYGIFLDPDTQLAITVSKVAQEGEVGIDYDGGVDNIILTEPDHGKSRAVIARIDGDSLHLHRVTDNRKLDARRIVPNDSESKDSALTGDYHCAEIESSFHCEGEDGMLYGSFDGYLGKGPASPMRYLGSDVWALSCPRGLDAPAPGDWTMAFSRDENKTVIGVTVGCWLARGLHFVKRV